MRKLCCVHASFTPEVQLLATSWEATVRNAGCLADMWGPFVCHKLFAFPRKNLARASPEVSCVLRIAPLADRYCWVLCGESSSLPKCPLCFAKSPCRDLAEVTGQGFGTAYFRLCQCGVVPEAASCKEIKLGTAKWHFSGTSATLFHTALDLSVPSCICITAAS